MGVLAGFTDKLTASVSCIPSSIIQQQPCYRLYRHRLDLELLLCQICGELFLLWWYSCYELPTSDSKPSNELCGFTNWGSYPKRGAFVEICQEAQQNGRTARTDKCWIHTCASLCGGNVMKIMTYLTRYYKTWQHTGHHNNALLFFNCIVFLFCYILNFEYTSLTESCIFCSILGLTVKYQISSHPKFLYCVVVAVSPVFAEKRAQNMSVDFRAEEASLLHPLPLLRPCTHTPCPRLPRRGRGDLFPIRLATNS